VVFYRCLRLYQTWCLLQVQGPELAVAWMQSPVKALGLAPAVVQSLVWMHRGGPQKQKLVLGPAPAVVQALAWNCWGGPLKLQVNPLRVLQQSYLPSWGHPSFPSSMLARLLPQQRLLDQVLAAVSGA